MQNSTYKAYKTYTREFLEWTQKKYQKIQKKATNKISWTVLNDYRSCIDQIIDNNRVVSAEEEGEVFRVLKSIEKAVKFRKQMNELFYRSPETDEAREENEKHLFFIAFLQECFQKLKDWIKSVTVALKSEDNATNQSNFSKFSDLEDFLEINLMEEEMTALSLESKRSSSFNLDEIEFSYGELKFSMISLLLDIVSLGERVNDSWRRLTSEKISVITATMVNFTAIKEIKALEKAFQLFYPSCTSALDFFLTLQKHFPSSKYPKMYEKRAIREYFAILLFFLTRDGTCYASYTVLDPKEALSSNYFKLLFPDQYGNEKFQKEFLEIYSEISGILNWSIVSICFFARMDHLVEVETIAFGARASFEDLQQTFVFHFTQPFERAREQLDISLSLLFNSWTLIQSIQILTENDENGIRKLGYYCSHYTRKRLDNYNHSHIKTLIEEKGLSKYQPITDTEDFDIINELLNRLPEDVQKEQKKKRNKSQEKEILGNFKAMQDSRKACLSKSNKPKSEKLKLPIDEFCLHGEPYMLLCHNPYLYGCLLFKSIYYDLNSSTALVFEMNCHSRLIAMLYSALKTEGYLTEEIPILEYFLKEFGIRILRGSLAKSGEYQSKLYSINPYYNRTERLSPNPNISKEFPEVDQRYFSARSGNVKSLQRKNQELQQVFSVSPFEISAVLKLTKDKTFDRIVEIASQRKKETDRSGLSFGHELIDSVEEQFELEIFHHRYLSLDFTLLFESFYEVIDDMYEKIPAIRHFISQHYPANENVHKSILFHGAVLEMEIFNNLLAAELDRPKSVRRLFTNGFAQDLVKVFQDYFSSKSYEDYFILPPTPKYKEMFFGSACSVPSFSSSTLKSTIVEDERIFNETMTTIDEKLYSVKKILPFGTAAKQNIITYIKNAVQLHPNIVKFIRKQLPVTPQGIRYPYFPTLLDHALSGKLQDQDFAEWLVAMGGFQLFANRSEIPNANEYPADLPSQLQLAFQSGNYWAICLLLAETKGKTIPYQNEISGNNVFHYFSMNIYKFNSKHLEQLASMILFLHALSNSKNKAGLYPGNYLPKSLPQDFISQDHFVFATMVDMMAKDRGLLKQFGYDDEQIRGPTKDYHNKQAIDLIGMEDHAKPASNKAKKVIKYPDVRQDITDEDEKKAKDAERELLELLENEDKQQPKKKQQPTKKGGKKK